MNMELIKFAHDIRSVKEDKNHVHVSSMVYTEHLKLSVLSLIGPAISDLSLSWG